MINKKDLFAGGLSKLYKRTTVEGRAATFQAEYLATKGDGLSLEQLIDAVASELSNMGTEHRQTAFNTKDKKKVKALIVAEFTAKAQTLIDDANEKAEWAEAANDLLELFYKDRLLKMTAIEAMAALKEEQKQFNSEIIEVMKTMEWVLPESA